jgi:ABC-type lipoprotein export system ATPase subunit
MERKRLTLDNVSYRYGKDESSPMVLNGISYSFDNGLLYSVVGPSGSGKSTLMSLMAGLDSPTEGNILYNDININDIGLNRYRKENVAVIYQQLNLFPLLTVIENVMYPLRLHKAYKIDAEKKAKEALTLVNISDDKYKKKPDMLSGGEQQRVAIARALAMNANLILSDEPTGNLDVKNSENIFGLLQTLAHEQDKCVIVVTHNMQMSSQTDEIIHIVDGKICDVDVNH